MFYHIYLTLFVLTFNAIDASIYSNLKQNVLSLLYEPEPNKENSAIPKRRDSMRYFNHKKQLDEEDKKIAQEKAMVLKSVRAHEEDKGRDMSLSQFTEREDKIDINMGQNMPPPKFIKSRDKLGNVDFHMDPVLNDLMVERFGSNARRAGSSSDSDTDSKTSSSSSGENFWMNDWEEHWMKKKFEALNSSIPRGDVVNMVAARPWGVACGDPNQHDMPWGSCMLPAECDAEYRIYRGDYFCGRTSYICCALLATNYDMYQGLDVSFEASSFETSDSDRINKKKDVKKRRDSKKRKRRRDRERRKKNIQKSIRRIIREIKTILTKAYKNGTAQRKRKTKELKRFIDMMKKQYRKDRKAVVNVHEFELGKIDEKLQSKLNHIQGVNEAFMGNDTFSDIVINGTVNKENLQRFLRAHPELANFFKHRRTGFKLTSDIEEQEPKSEHIEPESEKGKPQVLDYDLEYGMLYY